MTTSVSPLPLPGADRDRERRAHHARLRRRWASFLAERAGVRQIRRLPPPEWMSEDL